MHIDEAQQEVANWVNDTFGLPNMLDKKERLRRFMEESLELCQACGVTPGEVQEMILYVYGRPTEPQISSEVGGVLTTLMALATNLDIDCNKAYTDDCAKRWGHQDKIRTKQMQKHLAGVGRPV